MTRRSLRARTLAALAVGAGWLVFASAAQASDPSGVVLQQVGGASFNFAAPIYVTSPPGDRDRIFVVQRGGLIRIVRNDAVLPQAFLNLGSRTSTEGERGLLSMAFAPDYATSGKFYAYYTACVQSSNAACAADTTRAQGDLIAEEYQRNPANPDLAAPATRREVLRIPHPGGTNHNGGTIQFGPDGYLYLATGDGGTGGATAQDLTSKLGKILRIDPRQQPGGAPYGIPADNPFVDGAGPNQDEVWTRGLRNPFRFSFDRLTGDLVVGDVGQNTWEEVDFRPRAGGGGRGENFGWNTCEGRFKIGTTTTACPITPPAISPIYEYDHSATGGESVLGGVVVRDSSFPALSGRYIFGDTSQQFIKTAIPGIPDATDVKDLAIGTNGSWVNFGETASGCVYAVNLAGPVFRVAPMVGGTPCPDPTLTVRTTVSPASDAGHFDLRIDSDTVRLNGRDGDSGTRTLQAGSYTVSEAGSGGTSLADYDTSIECRKGSAVVASGGGPSLGAIPLGSTDDVMCTVANARRSAAGAGGEGSPSADTSAPVLKATFTGHQRVFAQRGDVIVYATCDEDCSLFSFGTVSVPKAAASVFRLGKAHTHTRPGRRAKLRLRVPKRSYQAIKRALKLGERVTATVTIRAKDSAGNKRFGRRKIRLVR